MKCQLRNYTEKQARSVLHQLYLDIKIPFRTDRNSYRDLGNTHIQNEVQVGALKAINVRRRNMILQNPKHCMWG